MKWSDLLQNDGPSAGEVDLAIGLVNTTHSPTLIRGVLSGFGLVLPAAFNRAELEKVRVAALSRLTDLRPAAYSNDHIANLAVDLLTLKQCAEAIKSTLDSALNAERMEDITIPIPQEDDFCFTLVESDMGLYNSARRIVKFYETYTELREVEASEGKQS